MRLRLTETELSVERRDSMRMSRSRAAICALCARERVVVTASRRSFALVL